MNSVAEPEPVGTGTPLVGAGDGAGKKMRKKIMFYYFLVILYKKELESELELVKKGTWSQKKRTGPTTLFITFCGGSFPVFLLTKSFTYSKMNRSRTKSLEKNIFFFTRVRSQNKMKFI